YIQMMAILDLLSSFAYLPFVFDKELCLYSSYTYAFYFTHFGWMVADCLRTFSSYVLLFLSYDRFLGIWYPVRFKAIKQKGLSRRMFIVGSLLVVSFIPVMCIGHVTSQPGEKWLGLAGIRLSNKTWTPIYKPYLLLIACLLPSMIIVGLSMALIIGIFKKRLFGSKGIKRKRQFFQTLAVLVLNITYVMCIIPYLAAVMTYKIEKGKCFGNVKSETMLFVSHTFILLWSTVNIIIYFLVNKEFLKEAKIALLTLPFLKSDLEDSRKIIQNMTINIDTRHTGKVAIKRQCP
ncbi:unnamed protein product, partial [Meganyctiphanes norvegica]